MHNISLRAARSNDTAFVLHLDKVADLNSCPKAQATSLAPLKHHSDLLQDSTDVF
jgi:hypothetical protein